MSEMPGQPASPFVWHELNAKDGDRACTFYTHLLGWGTTDVDMGPFGMYTMFQQNGKNIGGIVRMKGTEWDGLPPHWSIYIQVEDVDVSAKRAEELGGKVCVAPFDVPNIGRTCVVQDPDGAAFYLFTPKMSA